MQTVNKLQIQTLNNYRYTQWLNYRYGKWVNTDTDAHCTFRCRHRHWLDWIYRNLTFKFTKYSLNMLSGFAQTEGKCKVWGRLVETDVTLVGILSVWDDFLRDLKIKHFKWIWKIICNRYSIFLNLINLINFFHLRSISSVSYSKNISVTFLMKKKHFCIKCCYFDFYYCNFGSVKCLDLQ